MPYTLFEHRHRFAVWAGARAAQRAFTSVENLRDALAATGIRAFVESPEALQVDVTAFEKIHRECCGQIVAFLEDRGVANPAFGRAAKLIAVYLKAMVVTGPHAQTSLAAVVHPPIDRVLLQNLASSAEIQSPHKRLWRTVAWTQLTEAQYYELIEQLRSIISPQAPWWTLEKYWTVTGN